MPRSSSYSRAGNNMFLKLHTPLGAKMPSVGTKTRLYGILKTQLLTLTRFGSTLGVKCEF